MGWGGLGTALKVAARLVARALQSLSDLERMITTDYACYEHSEARDGGKGVEFNRSPLHADRERLIVGLAVEEPLVSCRSSAKSITAKTLMVSEAQWSVRG